MRRSIASSSSEKRRAVGIDVSSDVRSLADHLEDGRLRVFDVHLTERESRIRQGDRLAARSSAE
jgi:hypothetical protein